MYPYITVFGRTIGTYSLVSIIGALLMGLVIYKLSEKQNISPEDSIIVYVVAMLGAFVGSHLLYGITNISEIIELIKEPISFTCFLNKLSFYMGGMVFYGGLIGGILTTIIYVKIKNMDLRKIGATFAPGIPLFHAFGRIGCFLAGCCYGIESKYGFIYTNAIEPSANGVRRLPVQLIEAVVCFAIFAILLKMFKNEKTRSMTFDTYLVIYPTCRFILEFFRGDNYRGFVFGLSTSQIISIALILIVVLRHCMKRKN